MNEAWNDDRRSLDAQGLSELVDRVKAEIVADVEEGRLNSKGEPMPITVSTYSELHDYVDANCYGGACDDDTTVTLGDFNAISDIIDRWLRNGGLKTEIVAKILYRKFSTNRIAEWEDIAEWDRDEAFGRRTYRDIATDVIRTLTTSADD